jgi:AMP-binding enzyme/sulfatase-like protein
VTRAVAARSARWTRRGLRPGDRVFLHSGNRLEFFAELLALWRLGACAVPLDPRLTRVELERLVEAASPRFSVVDDSVEVASALPASVAGGGADEADGTGDLPPDLAEPGADALILFTSGSSGRPKGVVHTHASLRARWAALRHHLGLAAYARTLCLLPTHFGHGLICNSLFPWLAGQDLFITPPFRPDLLARLGTLIDEHHITFLSSVPAVWRLALKVAKPPRRAPLAVLGAYFASLPRMTDGHHRRSYAFSGFRHRTADFVSFARNLGYRAAGFEALAGRLGARAAADAGPLGVHDGPLLREAAATVTGTADGFVLYVMTGTSHSPWAVPDGAPMPLGNGPVGTFRYVDDSIRAFVERLRAQRADFDQTLIVVTGDHTSIPFGTQRIERLRVPLVLAGPPMTRARGRWPARSEAEVSQVDILPTIATLLDGTRPYAGMGRSMLEPRDPAGAGIITSDRTDTFYFKDGFALRFDLHSGDADLFAVHGDELRPTDVSAQHPEVSRRLTREFLALYETTDRLMRENRVFPRAR